MTEPRSNAGNNETRAKRAAYARILRIGAQGERGTSCLPTMHTVLIIFFFFNFFFGAESTSPRPRKETQPGKTKLGNSSQGYLLLPDLSGSPAYRFIPTGGRCGLLGGIKLAIFEDLGVSSNRLAGPHLYHFGWSRAEKRQVSSLAPRLAGSATRADLIVEIGEPADGPAGSTARPVLAKVIGTTVRDVCSFRPASAYLAVIKTLRHQTQR